ncbi:mitochondrial thiamine pyrophosphate transporter [Coemansia sp. RSA 485]|nr:mitochondrial thiamine pyrophosphate transporter [Coemansia sp. RSA 485]
MSSQPSTTVHPVQTKTTLALAKQDTTSSDAVLLKTSRTKSTRPLTSFENVLCGATAGLLSRFLVAPFDVVKITLQLQTHHSPGVLACAARIFKQEGIRGLFKGNLSAEYLYLTYGGAQFVIFGQVEQMLGRIGGMPKQIRSFVGGAAAGAMATSLTYPLDLLRTRFIAQQSASRVHQSMLDAVRLIYRQEGIRGFYRGLWPACLQIMPYMGIVFTSYDVLGSGYRWVRRNLLETDSGVAKVADAVQDAVIGGGAAVVGKCCVYPLDLVRKRLQVQGPLLRSYAGGNVPKYSGMTNALVYIVRNEGFLSLFRGLTPALIKAAPASAAVFYIYGHTRDLVLTLRPE